MKTSVTKIGTSGRATGKRQTAKAVRDIAKPSRTKSGRARASVVAAATVPNQKRPTGKLGHVLDAVAAKRGASLDELVKLTGWQPHTARAALTRLRQRGFAVGLREADDRKAYHLAEAASQ